MVVYFAPEWWSTLPRNGGARYLGISNYSPTRGSRADLPILGNLEGYLQTNGYCGYNRHGKQKGVIHMACWAHARREFERALDNDKARAEKVLLLIQKLYAVERKAREEGYSLEQVKNLRLETAFPSINELGGLTFKEMKTVFF